MDQIESLNRQFSVPGLVFRNGQGGLIQAVVQTATCSGSMFLHGAHVAEWTPAGHKPVLWISRESCYATDKPIRGGIPICFPWFGPHPADPTQPAHGMARTSQWTLLKTESTPGDCIALELLLCLKDFSLEYRVEFGPTLKLTMKVSRTSPAGTPASNSSTMDAKTCELALHTYFAIGDIHSVQISGLENASYIDKMDGGATKPADGTVIEFKGETDRVYINTDDTCELNDSKNFRRITVEKTGSKSTVIWNPWIAKSQRMVDFGDQEWPEMVCIETANVGPNSMSLRPGEMHGISVQIAVQ